MAIATARHKHKQHIIEKFIFFKNFKTFVLFKTIHTHENGETETKSRKLSNFLNF